LVGEVLAQLKQAGLGNLPVVVGGIIPPEDERRLLAAGVARVYTPKDFELTQIMADIVEVIDRANKEAA
jgi:(2R)-ethylmalonyl-CoA mutase